MRLIRWAIELITGLLCYAKRNRRLVPCGEEDLVKINLGCGLAVTKDWINVDGSLNSLVAAWPLVFHKLLYRMTGAHSYYSLEAYCSLLKEHRYMHHDLSYGIPFVNDSVDVIYTSHFLEHLHHKDALKLLSESYRVLKPHGMIRVCIPDLAYAVSLYEAGMKEKMLDSYFFVDEESYFARHKYMYDFELLRAMMHAAGFQDIRRCAYREGKTPDIDKLDNRPEDTLFVEALKS